MAKIYIVKKYKNTQYTRSLGKDQKDDYKETLYVSTLEKANKMLDEWVAEELEDVKKHNETIKENVRKRKCKAFFKAHVLNSYETKTDRHWMILRNFYIYEAELL